jgi:Tol biopolymer transport system component
MASDRSSARICGWLLLATLGCGGRQPLELPPVGGVATPNGGAGGASSGTGAGGASSGTGAGGASTASGGAGGATTGSGGSAGGPDTSGPWLFFDSLRGLNRDIYAVQADGSSLKRITTSPATEREPAVSADGKTLAYSSDQNGSFQLFLMPLPQGTPRQLTKGPMSAQQPAWSPDGARLSFRSDAGLFVIGVDGQGQREVPESPEDAMQNEHAVFASNHVLVFDRLNQIHQLDLDTKVETSVVHNWTTTIEHPSISPDGHSIAFDVWCEQPGPSIWIVPLAADTNPCQGGSRVTAPAEGPARLPSFSPDGVIAFEHGDGIVRISVVTPGGAAADVTKGGDDRNPSWSPAGLMLP